MTNQHNGCRDRVEYPAHMGRVVVRHSVYLTAVFPQRGQSLIDLYGGVLPNSLMHRPEGAVQVTDDFDGAWKSFGRGFERDAANYMLMLSHPDAVAAALLDVSIA